MLNLYTARVLGNNFLYCTYLDHYLGIGTYPIFIATKAPVLPKDIFVLYSCPNLFYKIFMNFFQTLHLIYYTNITVKTVRFVVFFLYSKTV